MSDILKEIGGYPEDASVIMSKRVVADVIDEIARLRAELAAERGMVAELKSWRKVVGDQLLAEIRNSTNLQAERDAMRAERDAMKSLAYDRLLQVEATETERDALRELLREASAALRFYENPFERTNIHGDDVRVPDFYGELCFGETAELTLARIDAALNGDGDGQEKENI